MDQATTNPTRVVSKKQGVPYDVYIGRGSRWGNPFRITDDCTRAQAITLYELHLLRRPDLLARVGELYGLTLCCYCAPEPCHGDVLARYAQMAHDRTGVFAPRS